MLDNTFDKFTLVVGTKLRQETSLIKFFLYISGQDQNAIQQQTRTFCVPPLPKGVCFQTKIIRPFEKQT